MNKLVKESIRETEVTTKPIIKPTTKPTTKPGRTSPIPGKRPSVIPKPKATAEEVAKKYLEIISLHPGQLN